MLQYAVVKKIIDAETAEISVRRQTACDGCRSSCSGCSSDKVITALAYNRIAAAVGDHVIVHSRTEKIIKTAAFVYLIPLVALFTGYGISSAFSSDEKLSVAAGMFSFFLGLLTVAVFGRASRNKNRIACEIREITG